MKISKAIVILAFAGHLLRYEGMSAEEPICCGRQDVRGQADRQQRLDSYTRSAMGLTSVLDNARNANFRAAQDQMSAFSKDAASFAAVQATSDPEAAVRLFGDMVLSRSDQLAESTIAGSHLKKSRRYRCYTQRLSE